MLTVRIDLDCSVNAKRLYRYGSTDAPR